MNIVILHCADKEGEETIRLIKESGGEGMFVKTDVSSEECHCTCTRESQDVW
jgi:hypothetical protein